MSPTNDERPDSITSQEPHKSDVKKEKSRRPPNTAFRQQRLKAWQPILTPKTVLPLFFVIGIIFAPVGGLLLWASSQVEEISIDYSNCGTDAPTGGNEAEIPSSQYSSYFRTSQVFGGPPTWKRRSTGTGENVCTLEFDIPNNIGPPVFFYYRLTNFYQNHRRYVKSFDPDQLLGQARSNSTIASSDCDPLTTDPATGKAYYPCGLIANSLFNDSFSSPVNQDTSNNKGSGRPKEYTMTNKGIAWSSDANLYGKTTYQLDSILPPPNWHKKFPNGYTKQNPPPNLKEWEEFQVWMRTAGLPYFSKLARRNDDQPMTAGRYQVEIKDHFPVTIYGGTKEILISTRTIMGGKNPFLGVAYVVVGGVCILLGTLFTITHLVKPRKLGDHTYLTWNNDQPSTATATGRSPRPGDSA